VTRIETIAGGRIDFRRVGFVDTPLRDIEDYLMRAGDLLLSHINSVPHIGKVARYDGSRPLVHGMNLLLLRWRSDRLDPLFGYYALASTEAKRYFERNCKKAVSQASLNRKQIAEYAFLLPPLPEQRKIAAILSSVDETIEKTEAVIEQLQVVKKAMMEELLTRGIPGRHTRFKKTEIGEIPEEWEVVALEDACQAVIDCKNRTPPFTASGHPVVRTPDVRDGQLLVHQMRRTDPLSYVEWTRKGVPVPGDVLLTREAPIGEACIIPDGMAPCLGQRMMLLRPRTGRVRGDYLLAVLLSAPAQERLLALAGGSTVGHVRVRDIRTFPIAVPRDLREQEAIGKAVRGSTDLVTAEMTALAQAVRLKGALGSALLSGDLRVTPDEGVS